MLPLATFGENTNNQEMMKPKNQKTNLPTVESMQQASALQAGHCIPRPQRRCLQTSLVLDTSLIVYQNAHEVYLFE